jgi:hypothetical protein
MENILRSLVLSFSNSSFDIPPLGLYQRITTYGTGNYLWCLNISPNPSTLTAQSNMMTMGSTPVKFLCCGLNKYACSEGPKRLH